MARMPGATWVGPHHDNGKMTRWDIVCIHTIVGHDPAHAAHFSTGGYGEISQSRDTVYASAANYEGNHRVIAIENEDTGAPFPTWNRNDGHQVPAFSERQIEAIAKICAWAYKAHGIPLVACPNSKPTSRGIAYHRQGIPGNFLAEGYKYPGIVPGGEVWTTSPGKACPGDRRIAQIPQIIQRARELAGLEEDDMQLDDVIDLTREVDGKTVPTAAGAALGIPSITVGGALANAAAGGFKNWQDVDELVKELGHMHENLHQALDKSNALTTKVDALAAKLDQVAAGNVDYAALAKAVVDEQHRRLEA